MTGKLRILDAGLLVAAGLLYWQLRQEWTMSHARDLALIRSTLPAAHVPGLAPLDKVGSVSAADFADVAMNNLFSQDRNPTVIVDPPKPAPEKPVPPFPVAHGVMLWEGVPPTIVLSEKAAGPQKGYHPGETIGQWTLVSLDNQFVDLEWDGKDFKKRIDELIDRTPVEFSDPKAPAAAKKPATPAPAAAPATSVSHTGPGVDMGGGYKACYADDKSAEGTVVDGMKKVVSATPFGSVCRWEQSK